MTTATTRNGRVDLHMAVSRYPHTSPLLDGQVVMAGCDTRFEPMTGSIVRVFREMARHHAFDVAEMGLSTAWAARVHKTGLSPLPVFLTRRFDVSALMCRQGGDISTPERLSGARIGVRSPFVTDVVWCAGLLTDEYGVDLSTVQWVVTDDEHLPGTILPHNTERRRGASLGMMLQRGDVDAIISPYHPSGDGIIPMIPDVEDVNRRLARYLGGPTIHHVLVVRDELLDRYPALPRCLVESFERAKEPFLRALARGDDILAELHSDPHGAQHIFGVDRTCDLQGPDPMPYGVDVNGPMLRAFLRYTQALGLIPADRSLQELFEASPR